MSAAEPVLGLQSDYLNSNETVPAAARKLSDAASTCRKNLFEEALGNLRSEQGIANLVGLFFDIVKGMDFDAYCDALINEDLPLRGQDDTEDQDYLIEKRAEEMDRMAWNGAEIKKTCPSLAALKDTTLGYFLLRANGEYPGGRNSSWVYPPKDDDLEGVSKFLLGLVFHGVCFKGNRKSHNSTGVDDALAYSVNRVIKGASTSHAIFDDYAQLTAFCTRLDGQNKFLDGIWKWRETEADMQAIRNRGEYLYVGTLVGREMPMGLADLFAKARSSGFAPVVVEQTLSDMSQAHL